MDINLYLKSAFQVCPSIYRDFASFILKDDVVASILSPDTPTHCDRCGQEHLHLSDNETGVTLSCPHCGAHSGAPKKTKAQAVWSWHAKKDSVYFKTPPIFRANTYDVLANRASSNKKSSLSHAVEWLAGINFADALWKMQAKSGDYKALSPNEQEIVDTVIILLGLAKRQAVTRLEKCGVSIADENVQSFLSIERDKIVADRELYFPRYKDEISLTMRCKMQEIFDASKIK